MFLVVKTYFGEKQFKKIIKTVIIFDMAAPSYLVTPLMVIP
jgi:hypothetical protein